MSAIEGWKNSPLPDLLNLIKSGGTPNTSRTDYYGGDIPFVSIEDMTSCGKFLHSTKKKLTPEGVKNSNTWLVPEYSILYSIYATLGVPRINLIPVTTNQAILALINNKEKIDENYLFYWLESIRASVVNLSSQTTQSNLSSTTVKAFTVLHPTWLSEQEKIAEILSTIDRAIEQTEALIAKQQRIKTGLMQDLLTRGIDANGNLRTEQTHEFKDSPLGRIPVEWEICRLENVADFVTSGSRGWARYYSTEGSLFLRIGNLTRIHINMRLDDLIRVSPSELTEGNRTSVVPGDLLISITADLGIIAVIPDGFEKAYVNQHIALVRLKKLEVAPRFVGWFLGSRSGQTQFEKLNESGAKAGLNLSTIKNLLIPKMEITEQLRIASILDSSTEKTTEFQQRLTKLQALKTALMQDLLTGRKRVTSLLASTSKN